MEGGATYLSPVPPTYLSPRNIIRRIDEVRSTYLLCSRARGTGPTGIRSIVCADFKHSTEYGVRKYTPYNYDSRRIRISYGVRSRRHQSPRSERTDSGGGRFLLVAEQRAASDETRPCWHPWASCASAHRRECAWSAAEMSGEGKQLKHFRRGEMVSSAVSPGEGERDRCEIQ